MALLISFLSFRRYRENNEVPRRMASEPSFALPEQLLDFFVAYPIVLLGIQNLHKHINVPQQVLKMHRLSDVDRVIWTGPPFRKPIVQEIVLRLDFVSQRFE